MENEQGYKEILAAIIKNKMKIFGQLALKIARTSGGMDIDDKGGVIAITGEPVKVVEKLLYSYIQLSGRVAIFNARISILNIKKKYPGIKLPEMLS